MPKRFNPPPGWPPPPSPDWLPPVGWTPPTDMPPAPEGWKWFIHEPDRGPAIVDRRDPYAVSATTDSLKQQVSSAATGWGEEPVSPVPAWLLAGAPAVFAAAVLMGLSTINAVVLLVITSGVITAIDVRAILRTEGANSDGLRGFVTLFAPAYLWKRARNLNTNLATVGTWFGTFVAFLIAVALFATVPIDGRFVETSIRGDINSRLAPISDIYSGITVDCPDRVNVRVGESFTCIANKGDTELAPILVTVKTRDGVYSWNLASLLQ